MPESIITLGIGATPDDLTPFITTGLHLGTAEVGSTAVPFSVNFPRLALQLFEERDGDLLADFSDAEACAASTGPHGFRSLTCFVPMPLIEAFVLLRSSTCKMAEPELWLRCGFGRVALRIGRLSQEACN